MFDFDSTKRDYVNHIKCKSNVKYMYVHLLKHNQLSEIVNKYMKRKSTNFFFQIKKYLIHKSNYKKCKFRHVLHFGVVVCIHHIVIYCLHPRLKTVVFLSLQLPP